MIEKFKQHKNFIYMFIGFMAVSLIALPYFVLGGGTHVQLHDQMDGEILNYIYQAKYFLKGDIIPEFMNGMDKSSMTPPAPFGVLFYLLFKPQRAFAVMQWFVLTVGFFGMYKLCCKLGMYLEVCTAVAVLYCYISFYPTYGLASLGQPMLVLAVLYLLEEETSLLKQLLAYGMIVVYTGFSSLALIGYAWILTGAVLILWNLIKKNKQKALRLGLGTAVLTLVYMLTNLDLIKDVLGMSDFVSHRQEMVVSPTTDLLGAAKSMLLVGGSYSNVYSGAILVAAVLTLLVARRHARCKQIICIMIFLALGIIWAVLWNSEAILNIRMDIGGMITYFNADRVCWVFPFMWSMILAYVLDIWVGGFFTAKAIWLRVICGFAALGLCLIQGALEFPGNTLNKNMRLMLIDSYRQITWNTFYMEDAFEEMKEYMKEDTSSYSVVSLGIYPSVALYNGLTCADGYSNNYDLAHKHAFMKIMEEEMAKNKEAEALIKDWGNRLYLVSGEYGVSPLIGRGDGVVYHDVSYDVEAMKDLNIRYLLAAAPISNAAEIGLELVREEPFRGNGSYYEIWLYEVK